MNTYELIAPCHFGLESVLKREIYDLGYDITLVEDGKVTFEGDAEAICRANINLRTAERVLLKVGQFKAYTFTELFDQTKALPWEEFIPEDGKFWVTKEDGNSYPLRVTIIKDVVTIAIDTTGNSLHKRGYRPASGKAPISESLAAALIMLTPWKKDRAFVDPFCGSGTFPIEAAMIAANIAPGLNREFTAESWTNIIPKKEWYNAIEEANEAIDMNINTDIQGFDIDENVIKIARQNAINAGVDKLVHFQKRDVKELSHSGKYGFVITNPPYGERLEEKEALPPIYTALGKQFAKLDSWSAYVITSYTDIEKYFGRKADKNRKIYNGMLKTYFYSFLGPKPPKKKDIRFEK